MSFFFDVVDEIFQITPAIVLGPGEGMCKLTCYLLYLSNIFRKVSLIKQCKLKLEF